MGNFKHFVISNKENMKIIFQYLDELLKKKDEPIPERKVLDIRLEIKNSDLPLYLMMHSDII